MYECRSSCRGRWLLRQRRPGRPGLRWRMMVVMMVKAREAGAKVMVVMMVMVREAREKNTL